MREKIGKKGITKRLFSVALALAVVLSLMPMNSMVAYASIGSGSLSATITFSYDTDTSTTHISGTGAMPEFDEREMRPAGIDRDVWMENMMAWMDASNRRNLVIGEGITSISNAFKANSSINSVTFPSTLTTIVNDAFFNCRNLSSITIPAAVTSIGENAFYGSGLSAITFRGKTPPTLGTGAFDSLEYQADNDNLVIYVPAGKKATYVAKSGWATYEAQIVELTHTHDFTYTASNNVITATCADTDGGCALTDSKVSLTLTASSANYSGISNLDAFNTATGQSIKTSDVIIYKVAAANTTTGGTKVEGTPSEDGYYYASLTVIGKTAVKAFTIGNPKPDDGGNSGNDKAPGNFKHDTKQEADNLAGSMLNTKVDDLFSRVLTPQEQDEVKKEGVTTNVWLEVKPEDAKNISASNAEKIKNVTPAGYTIPSNGYLDINLWKKIGDRAATTVPNLSGKVSITVKVPADLQKSGRTYKIIRLHGGKAEALATTQDSNFNLTFETDGFSTYAIAYSDNVATAPASGTSPKTGEANSNYLILLICLAALSLLGLGTWRKRA